jgi:energy-coupling factor transporter ATP-binding protein EcfA2
MATHNHELVRNYGQRIVFLRDGTIEEDVRLGLAAFTRDRAGVPEPAPRTGETSGDWGAGR